MNRIYLLFISLVVISVSGLKFMPSKYDFVKSSIFSETANIANNDITSFNPADIKIIDLGMMKASWYGPRFHGRLTANGEVYDQMGLTAAHKSIPFGTLLRLTNPKTKTSVIVRINDRGPYIPGRQIDLSKKVAIILGIYKKGVAKIKVEKINVKGVRSPIIN